MAAIAAAARSTTVEWPSEKDFSGDLKVEVEVDVRPEFELPAFDGITVEVDAVEVDESAIDEELDRLRARFGTLVTVERPAATGDFVELDLLPLIQAKVDGVPVFDCHYGTSSGRYAIKIDRMVTNPQRGWLGEKHVS